LELIVDAVDTGAAGQKEEEFCWSGRVVCWLGDVLKTIISIVRERDAQRSQDVCSALTVSMPFSVVIVPEEAAVASEEGMGRSDVQCLPIVGPVCAGESSDEIAAMAELRVEVAADVTVAAADDIVADAVDRVLAAAGGMDVVVGEG
jgi:hypothetical protein